MTTMLGVAPKNSEGFGSFSTMGSKAHLSVLFCPVRSGELCDEHFDTPMSRDNARVRPTPPANFFHSRRRERDASKEDIRKGSRCVVGGPWCCGDTLSLAFFFISWCLGPVLCLRELEKTQEKLLASTEAGDLQRREDARARRLATAREVSVRCGVCVRGFLCVPCGLGEIVHTRHREF